MISKPCEPTARSTHQPARAQSPPARGVGRTPGVPPSYEVVCVSVTRRFSRCGALLAVIAGCGTQSVHRSVEPGEDAAELDAPADSSGEAEVDAAAAGGDTSATGEPESGAPGNDGGTPLPDSSPPAIDGGTPPGGDAPEPVIDSAPRPSDASGGDVARPEADAAAADSGVPRLPAVVTTDFPNQGWFGDAAISLEFRPGSTVIVQSEAVTGPCAMRAPAATGRCLKIVYTPPPGLVPPAEGGFVGLFFLTTLVQDHPDAMPPARIGEANWGLEPALPLPPGATRISFLVAGEMDGLSVAFKAGIAPDSFVMPETPVTLTTTWTRHDLSLLGASYSGGVYGAFAWILHDTTRAATFYLDSIVWQ
jgi:hypothetical protein